MPAWVYLLVVLAAVLFLFVRWVERRLKRASREQFVRSYMFPTGLFEKLHRARPGLDAKGQQLVARALRQFFLAYLKSDYRRVSMPSQAVDDLWHEFILFTRDYQTFCDQAFGRFLHHTPAVRMGTAKSDNEGLRRVWWFSCLEENINPRKATRLPLLFAIDRKLEIKDGFFYDLHCRRQLDRDPAYDGSGSPAVQCTDLFADSTIDKSLAGFGCGGGGGCIAGGDGGDGGCSGGCGGGCGGD
ncbi:MAG: hypothetical protein U0900_23885 [Myxococcota bacterium]